MIAWWRPIHTNKGTFILNKAVFLSKWNLVMASLSDSFIPFIKLNINKSNVVKIQELCNNL